MNTKQGLAPIVLVILLAVLVGGGYLVASKKSKVESVKKEVTAEQSDVSTKDWKTYRNEKYGFLFQYPTELVNSPKVYVTDRLKLPAELREAALSSVIKGTEGAGDPGTIADIFHISIYPKTVDVTKSSEWASSLSGGNIIYSHGGYNFLIGTWGDLGRLKTAMPIHQQILSTLKFNK